MCMSSMPARVTAADQKDQYHDVLGAQPQVGEHMTDAAISGHDSFKVLDMTWQWKVCWAPNQQTPIFGGARQDEGFVMTWLHS